jgi:two-component system, sensor histidine kinase RegB
MTPSTECQVRKVRSYSAILSTLSKLRFLAAITQLATVLTLRFTLMPHLAAGRMVAVIGVLLLSNFALRIYAPYIIEVKRWALGILLFDVLILTVLLALSGGAHNPFTVLYLVHVALTAVLLGPLELLFVLGICAVGYGMLFVWYVPLPACFGGSAHEGSGFSAHLHGMWVAFLIAGTATAAFMYQLSAAIARERETNERQVRLLGLATLAAGAAHEIGNPLATIKVAASELKLELDALGEGGRTLARDATLIVAEVERAWKTILGLSIGAGELTGEPMAPITVGDLLGRLHEQLEPGMVELDLHTSSPTARMRIPAQAVVTAFTQVVRNAIQASPKGAVVELEAVLANSQLHVSIRDRGPGIPSAILQRLGEPFLTTKEPGYGMGLGLFIPRSLVKHLRGQLAISSRPGGGTSVSIVLPVLEVR